MKTKLFGMFLALLMLMFCACAGAPFKPYEPPTIEFDKTPAYTLDLSSLQKPDKPSYILLDEDLQPVQRKEEARYLAFTKTEFKKISALSTGYNDQRTILGQQASLVNTHIDEINALKELVALREQMVKEYIALYAASENAYRREKYEHKWTKAEGTIVKILMSAGLVFLMLP